MRLYKRSEPEHRGLHDDWRSGVTSLRHVAILVMWQLQEWPGFAGALRESLDEITIAANQPESPSSLDTAAHAVWKVQRACTAWLDDHQSVESQEQQHELFTLPW